MKVKITAQDNYVGDHTQLKKRRLRLRRKAYRTVLKENPWVGVRGPGGGCAPSPENF